MSTSHDILHHEVSNVIQNNLYYEGSTVDLTVHLLQTYKHQSLRYGMSGQLPIGIAVEI